MPHDIQPEGNATATRINQVTLRHVLNDATSLIDSCFQTVYRDSFSAGHCAVVGQSGSVAGRHVTGACAPAVIHEAFLGPHHLLPNFPNYSTKQDLILVLRLANMAAATAVFNTFELLENIVVRLPIADILTTSRVCRPGQSVLEQSRLIRRILSEIKLPGKPPRQPPL